MSLYIDIAISMMLIFLVFSVIVYVIQELVAFNLQYRGKMLWRALAQVLDGVAFKNSRALSKDGIVNNKTPDLTELLFDHPQVQSLQKDDKKKPPYIPASNFALAVVEMIAQNTPAPSGNLLTDFNSGLDVLAKNVGYTVNGFLPGIKPTAGTAPPIVAILQSIRKVSGTIDDLRQNIEKWYNDYMNRVTGWYQTHTLLTVRLIAIAITIFFNLNAIRLVRDIANSSVLRNNLVGIAEQVTDHPEVVNSLYNRRFATDSARIRDKYKPVIDGAQKDSQKLAKLQREVEDSLNASATKFTGLQIKGIRMLTDTLSAVHLPIGWTSAMLKSAWNKVRSFFDGDVVWSRLAELGLLLLGWLITAGCLSMGAPFWFNLLIQVVNVRRAGVKPKGNKKNNQ
jgi:hypothetical protein